MRVIQCLDCNGTGFVIVGRADHHPDCSGGSECDRLCPVEVPEEVQCTYCGGDGCVTI